MVRRSPWLAASHLLAVSSQWGRGIKRTEEMKLFGVCSYMDVNLIRWGFHPYDLINLYYLPKAPNTTLSIKTLIHEFWRDTNIHPITLAISLSSIVRCLFKSFANFCMGLSVFLLLNGKRYLYIIHKSFIRHVYCKYVLLGHVYAFS